MNLTKTHIKILLAVSWWKADGLSNTFIGPGNVGQVIWATGRSRTSSHYARIGGKFLMELAAKGLTVWRHETIDGPLGEHSFWGWALTRTGRVEVARLKAEGYDLDAMIEEWNREKESRERRRLERLRKS